MLSISFGGIMSGSTTVLSSNGVALPIDNLAQVFTYSGSFIATASVVYNGITYTQTFTNNGTQITNISQWTPA
jgi:hypothetical protein